jgi:hypothetical protein
MKRREALKKADSGFENGVAGWEPPAASEDVINDAFDEADLG